MVGGSAVTTNPARRSASWVASRSSPDLPQFNVRLSIDVVGTDPDTALPGRPELVVCRHAGPGDSFILIHGLVNWFDREPRIVLKETLQWDPAIDVLLNRLPNRFIAPGDKREEPVETQIAHLATGLDANDAFVIFPEGGNFTPGRRSRAIHRLHAMGLHGMAARAESMRHVLAPRPRRAAGGAGRRTGRRGHLRRAHRPGPDADRRRCVAGVADGQADSHAILVGATRGDPSRPGGTHRMALRLVVPDRFVDREEPF